MSHGKGASARSGAQGPTSKHKLARCAHLCNKMNNTSGVQAWYGGLRHFLADPLSKDAGQMALNAMAAPAPAPAAASASAGRSQIKAPALQTIPPELRFVNGSAPSAQLPGARPSPLGYASNLAVCLCTCFCLIFNACFRAQPRMRLIRLDSNLVLDV